jgi:hypothetical protein
MEIFWLLTEEMIQFEEFVQVGKSVQFTPIQVQQHKRSPSSNVFPDRALGLNTPVGIAVNKAGEIYVSQLTNHIHKIENNMLFDITSRSTEFKWPYHLAFLQPNVLVYAEFGNNSIKAISTTDGEVTAIAGTLGKPPQ